MGSSISKKRRPPGEKKPRDCDPTGLSHFANVLREVLGLDRLYHDGSGQEISRMKNIHIYSEAGYGTTRMITKKGSGT